MVDAESQVFSRGQIACDLMGCFNIAEGGACTYRVCFSKGCGRNVCSQHMAPTDDPEVEDDFLASKVCIECKDRANRAYLVTILLVIVVPLLIILPLILLNGGDTHSS